MKDEYIIINKTAIQKRIGELEKLYKNSEKPSVQGIVYNKLIVELKQILSQSTPLIPEIEKAFDAGQYEEYKEISLDGGETYETFKIINEKEDYISNLKLDI